jgi:serralysin
VGTTGADILIGNAGANRLDGGGGNDTLSGGGGLDTFIGGDGVDTLDLSRDVTLINTVKNGGFNSASNWIVYNGVSINNGRANVAGAAQILSQTGALEIGKTYTVSFDYNMQSGSKLRITNGTINAQDTVFVSNVLSGSGQLAVTFVAKGTALSIEADSQVYTGSIDNVQAMTVAEGLKVDLTAGTVSNGSTLQSIESVVGTTGADILIGNAGANRLDGGGGNDLIDGSAGIDFLFGGDGNDTYVVDNTGDVVVETSTLASEIDIVQTSISYTLGSNLEQLVLTDTSDINGTGNTLNNTITGNAAANVLNGGLGSDTLSGGLGADRFVFNTALGTQNIDSITDFSRSQLDTLALDDAIFTKLAGRSNLATNFRLLSQASIGADDFLVYNAATGQLYYDATGTGSAGNIGTAQLFATLTNKPQDLTGAQFVVI